MAIFFALTSILFDTFVRLVYRFRMSTNGNPGAILIFNLVLGGLFLCVVFGPPATSIVYHPYFEVLFLNGAIWTLFVLTELRALEHLDLAQYSVMCALKYVLFMMIALLAFSEVPSALRIAGACLIVAGILLTSDRTNAAYRRGLVYQIISIVCLCAAVSLDKYLTAVFPVSIIAIFGFLFPGLFVLLLRFRNITAIPHEIRASKGWLIPAPFALAIGYLALVKALQLGQLSMVVSVLESQTVLMFLVGYLILKETRAAATRLFASILTAIGAVVVTLG